MKHLTHWLHNRKGQGTVEYLLVIGVIVVAVIAAGFAFRDELSGIIKAVTDRILSALQH